MTTAEQFDAQFDAFYNLAIDHAWWLALPAIWAAFVGILALQGALMAAMIFLPGWYYVRVLGPERGLILFAATLMIAYQLSAG